MSSAAEFRRLSALALVVAVSSFRAQPALAQAAGPAEGHSVHGDVFDEGPRQAAHPIAGTGKVHFDVASKVPGVQAMIDQGVGELHGYWYYEAERSFRHAAFLDPDCATAYWGMALANVNNVPRAKKFIAKAAELSPKVSKREQRYIEAWKTYYDKSDSKETDAAANRRKALTKALEGIVYDYPDDLEAKALLVAQLWENSSKGVPIPVPLLVDALIKDVLAANPQHPVHHYRIHLWDVERAQMGLNAAANCGPAAPGIAHMWHMPGHIYSKLKRYDDAAWQQEASARVDHAYMLNDLILPDQIHNYAHNNEWLIRDLMFVGRAGDALSMAKALLHNPAHPKSNPYEDGKSFKFGRERLCDVLTAFELWDDAICLADSPLFGPTSVESEQVRRLRMLGRAAFRKGDATRGCDVLSDLMKRKQTIIADRDTAVAKAKAEPRTGKDAEKDQKQAVDKAESGVKPRLTRLDEAIAELTGYLHLRDRAFDDAKASFALAGKLDPMVQVELRFASGKQDEAIDLLRKEVKSHASEVLPQARLVEGLARAGRTDDAKKEFKTLQTLAFALDTHTPLYQRIANLAKGWDTAGDWRTPRETPKDLGPRPPLASLGPFSWSPPPASQWTLPGENGGQRSLADGGHRPQIVVFSLGSACLHCSEQAQKFADERAKFAAAGLAPVIISTDAVADLHKAAEAWKRDDTDSKAPYPFPLLSDSSLTAFKAYRCFDDFEKRPLHGTFLVDGDGRLRWWDIGPEPFMNVDFLIEESQRLLALDYTHTEPVELPSASPCSPGAKSAGTAGQ